MKTALKNFARLYRFEILITLVVVGLFCFSMFRENAQQAAVAAEISDLKTQISSAKAAAADAQAKATELEQTRALEDLQRESILQPQIKVAREKSSASKTTLDKAKTNYEKARTQNLEPRAPLSDSEFIELRRSNCAELANLLGAKVADCD